MKSITINADCMEVMRGFADKQFELAIVDVPYGIGAGGSFGHYWNSTAGCAAASGVRNIEKEWDSARPSAEYWNELFRVSKDQIVWGGNYFTDFLPPSRGWIVWDKKQPIGASFAMAELAWTSFDKSIKTFSKWSSHVTQGERIHPTQKNIELYKWVLRNYASPGDAILDTHLGSGSSRIAADEMGHDFTGIELDRDYFEAQERRWKIYKSQGQLFPAK